MNLHAPVPGRRHDLPPIETTWLDAPLSMPARLSALDILALAFKAKFLVILAFLAPLAGSVALMFLMPPVYRAQTSLVVGQGPEYLTQGDGSASMTAPTSTKQEFINTEIELLNSLAVVKSTIERVGLENIYPDIAKSPPKTGSALDAAIAAFRASTRVDLVKLSNMINVSFDHRNPATASMVLDQFINSYQNLHAHVFSTRRAGSYEETIARDTAELEKLERERAAVKAAGAIYDLGQQRTSLITYRVDAQKRLHETVDSLTRLQDRLNYLNSVRPQLSSEIRSVQTDPRAETVHARQMLFDLQQKKVTLLGTYSPDSAIVQRTDSQIAALRRVMDGMSDTAARVTTSVSPIAMAIDQEMINSRAEIPPLRAQKARYEALVSSIDDQLQHIEQGDSKLRVLDAHIDAQNDNLRAMRRLYDQARAEDEMELAKVTSVVQTSKAITPDRPVSPDKRLLLVGGILGGLIAAVGVVVLKVLTNRTFLSEGSVERYMGLPVLGSVPLRRPGFQPRLA